MTTIHDAGTGDDTPPRLDEALAALNRTRARCLADGVPPASFDAALLTTAAAGLLQDLGPAAAAATLARLAAQLHRAYRDAPCEPGGRLRLQA